MEEHKEINVDKLIGDSKKVADKDISYILTEGMKLSIDGYLYLVQRVVPAFYVLKRLEREETKKDEIVSVFKKGDEFAIRIGLRKHRFRIVKATGRAWFRVITINKLSHE